MKKLMLSAGVAALLAVGGWAAQAADQDIVIGADVEEYCTIDGSAPGAGSATIGLTLDGNVNTTPIPKVYPVVCNTAATATLTSLEDGLTGPDLVPGFDNYINYNASTSGFVGIVGTTTTGGAAAPDAPLGAGATGGASALPVTVTITPQANGQPLVAGEYEDTLTLAINPI